MNKKLYFLLVVDYDDAQIVIPYELRDVGNYTDGLFRMGEIVGPHAETTKEFCPLVEGLDYYTAQFDLDAFGTSRPEVTPWLMQITDESSCPDWTTIVNDADDLQKAGCGNR